MVANSILFPNRKYDYSKYANCPYDALSTGITTCVEEYKVYSDPQRPRTHNQYKNYQIDFNKCREVVKRAKNDKDGERLPLLLAYFTDYLFVWNLNDTGWEKTATWVYGNKEGVNYGEKEWDVQAYLEFDDAIYKKELDDCFWEDINRIIREKYDDDGQR